MDRCEVCEIQARNEAGDNPWAVARLQSGHVGLNPNQHYRGYTFFSARQCVAELRGELTSRLLVELQRADVRIERDFTGDVTPPS